MCGTVGYVFWLSLLVGALHWEIIVSEFLGCADAVNLSKKGIGHALFLRYPVREKPWVYYSIVLKHVNKYKY